MNRDTKKYIFICLFLFMGIISLSVGKVIIGLCSIALGAGIWSIFGGSSYNERNLYHKIIAESEDLTIEKLFYDIKDIETSFGKPWIANHRRFDGNVIIIGPGKYKDYILIGRGKKAIEATMSTNISSIESQDSARFAHILNTDGIEVRAKNYSEFAISKTVIASMLDDIVDIITKVAIGKSNEIPKEIGIYEGFYYHSKDPVVRDMEDNEYAKCSAKFKPLSVKIYDMESEELGSVYQSEGKYKINMSGEEYATIIKDTKSKNDEYYLDIEEGEVRLKNFRVVTKANLSCNYEIEINGIKKAVIASKTAIKFEDVGLVEIDMIASYDNDYLLLYIALLEFITTKNSFIR